MFLTCAVLSIFIYLFPACAPVVDSPADRQLRDQVNQLISELERAFETENTSGVMRTIHSDYSPSRSELRSNLRAVFRQFNLHDLDFHTLDFSRANDEINLELEWNLRWRDTDAGETERRRGRTTFRLRPGEDDTLQIISQRGDRLLGEKDPGEVSHRE